MGNGHVRDILEADGVDWGSASQKLVAVLMAYAADRKGICRQTQGEIAAKAVLSIRRVSDLIDSLCDLEVMARLGHGRYGVRFGLPIEGEQQTAPSPKGAEAERKRLWAICGHDQFIAFRPDGWPVLQSRTRGRDD